MPRFSQESLSKLSTCHHDLQVIFFEVIKFFDCIVLEGYRNQEGQEAAFKAGNTQLHYPEGKHNKTPSLAVDVAPYEPVGRVDWRDYLRFYYFGGFVMGIAKKLLDEGKITHLLTYGGDWDGDTQLKDENFRDLVHFQITL